MGVSERYIANQLIWDMMLGMDEELHPIKNLGCNYLPVATPDKPFK